MNAKLIWAKSKLTTDKVKTKLTKIIYICHAEENWSKHCKDNEQ